MEPLNWPAASGEVTSSKVERERNISDDGQEYTYYPRVQYSYTVDGRTYTSNRVSTLDFGTTTPNNHAREIVRKYRADRKIKV